MTHPASSAPFIAIQRTVKSPCIYRIKRAGFQVRFRRDLVVYATNHRRIEHGRSRKTLIPWLVAPCSIRT